MSVFQNNQIGKPDVYIGLTVDMDEVVGLFMNISDDETGAELLEVFSDDRAQIQAFFAAVETAKAEYEGMQ